MSITEKIQKIGLSKAYEYLEKDPDANIPKLMDWVDKFTKDGSFASQRATFRKVIENRDNNWYQLIQSIWTEIDPGVRRVFFENFMLNSNLIGSPKRQEYREKYGCSIPWAILMDPTSACNLHCTGCWAAEYGNRLNMDFDTLDSIITQGKEMGTYIYLYSGGEPLVRKDDVIALCNKHSDCLFGAFTNGTLIDEAFAGEMLRVKNFIPAISVEGFENATDFRRGKGTFAATQSAMKILKERKLPFGISCCYTNKNAEEIGSEAYFDEMIEWGAKFVWFFTYMPVGADAVLELMATAEQREYMYRQIRKFRDTKPIFSMDFWNDGEFVGGCIAGGRNFLHINANGDIEPCAFVHYSDSNIQEKTLLEAFCSPLFMQYHDNQPFSDNLLRPCLILDNPGRLAQMVERTEAHSTDLQHPEDAGVLCGKCKATAKKWKPVADRLWEQTHRNCRT